MNEVEIKPLGSYFEIDENGHVINPASVDKIQEEYKPAIKDIVEAYKNHFDAHLHSVYLRGSVAKGQAVENISDIDTFAYVDLPKDEIGTLWQSEAKNKLKALYPFAEEIELISRPLSAALDSTIILNQSICVYGEPVEVPKIKPGKEMMLHTPDLTGRITFSEKKLDDAKSEEEIKAACVWIMKNMLRTGFEITMERSGRYTRDLYPCYKGFSEYYPEREVQMKEILHYALNPTADKEKIKSIRDAFIPWLIEESRSYV